MKLREALERAKNGDKIKRAAWEGDQHFTKDEVLSHDVNVTLGVNDAISNDWKVIKAEPKVLTPDEVIKKVLLCEPHTITRQMMTIHVSYFELLAHEAHQNGQLKEWLNHKELREAAENMVKYYPNIERMNIHNLLGALRKAERNTGIKND